MHESRSSDVRLRIIPTNIGSEASERVFFLVPAHLSGLDKGHYTGMQHNLE